MAFVSARQTYKLHGDGTNLVGLMLMLDRYGTTDPKHEVFTGIKLLIRGLLGIGAED